MMRTTTFRDSFFIHLFALLHAGTAYMCRAFGLQDDLLLTLLTMALILVLCFRLKKGTKFMAAAIVVVNFVGYGLGMLLSNIFGLFMGGELVIYPLSTFLTTEIIGWGICGCGRLSKSRYNLDRDTGMIWLFIALVLIIVVRFVLILPLKDAAQRRDSINIILNYFFSCACLVSVAVYAMRLRRRADEEKEKANMAQYRYMSLKQQVNPHFLFNSLNSLEYLIREGSPEDAGAYTLKLADIYRYMIRSGEETVVPLRDELSFVAKYADLLRLRFPEGLELELDISEAAMRRSVVPCCVQLLVENATKHNAVRPDDPLVIRIVSDGDILRVSNNLRPKVGKPSSTGLGLKYIQSQYEDIGPMRIAIRRTDDEYIVELPLL